ncbi:hypothetical protein EJB05_57144, partial [Eragrostis curvula]
MWHLHAFVVFEPAESKHYKVLLVSRKPKKGVDEARRSMEWPPSRWRCHQLSPKTGWWRERVFVREGEVAGTVADLLMDSVPYSWEPRWRFSAYWQGALYLHCHGEYVARYCPCRIHSIEFSIQHLFLVLLVVHDHVLGVINGLQDVLVRRNIPSYQISASAITISEKGVYFAAIYKWQLRVWILTESSPDRTEWIVKHDRVLKPNSWSAVAHDYHRIKFEGPWILDDYEKRKTRADFDWSSDDDDVIQTVDWYENSNDDEDMNPDTFHVLGFHPYKEVIFLTTCGLAVAYHLNSIKVQFLGILSPIDYNRGLTDSFVYTPWIEAGALRCAHKEINDLSFTAG